jgi:hypothetical protein
MDSSFVPVPPHLVPSFRIWHFPPAGLHLSWTVFQRSRRDPVPAVPLVRRIAWERDRDFEALELPRRRRLPLEPTLRVTEHPLDPGGLFARVETASGLPLARSMLKRPYVAEIRREFGLDGFDVEGNDGRPVVRLEWDDPVPADLVPLARWAADLRPWLERARV